MSKSEVVRVDKDLAARAKEAGATMSRSVAAQISHWARIGRAVENAGVPSSAIAAVLARQADFDSLPDEDQAAVVELWNLRIADTLNDLDLAADFTDVGQAYAELDSDGNVVVVEPEAPPSRPSAPGSRPATVAHKVARASSKPSGRRVVTKPTGRVRFDSADPTPTRERID